MKSIEISNIKNNILKEEYNQKLEKNLPEILNGYKNNIKYEYDNDLITLAYKKKSNNYSVTRFKNLNDEFKEIMKKQNIKVESNKPDSIKENMKNIFDYRKKIALRFKYNNNGINNNKNKKNLILQKSRSQIMNLFKNSKDNTLSTKNGNISLNGIKNQYYMKNNNSTLSKDLVVKEYKKKFLITGMNHKNCNNNKNEKDNLKYNKNNRNNKKAKKSLSAVNLQCIFYIKLRIILLNLKKIILYIILE